MTISKQTLSDNTILLFNLGSAHSIPTHKDICSFVEDINNISEETDLLTFTNSSQSIERGYLKDLGFDFHKMGDGRMGMHTISWSKFKETSEKILAEKEIRDKAEQKADLFFKEKMGRALQVGDSIKYGAHADYIEEYPYYRITQILSSGRVRFKNVDAVTKEPYGVEYHSGATDGGYETRLCHLVLCTREEFNAKVKEFMDELK